MYYHNISKIRINSQSCVLLFLFLAIFAISCKKNGSSLRSSSGYDYHVHLDVSGKTPKVGDQVFFDMDICDDKGKVLQTYRKQKQMPSLKILSPENITRQRNPIVNVLSDLSLGDSVEIIVPRDSIPGLPPEYDELSHLIYRIVVKEIMSEEAFQQKRDDDRQKAVEQANLMKERIPEIEKLVSETLDAYKANKLNVESTPKGVNYIIHDQGTGDIPVKDLMVTVHYYGVTVATGQPFDNSFEKGRGYSFRLGRGEVIGGWDDVISYLAVGTKASIMVPGSMAYGERGYPPDIPPNAELYFYVEIEEVFY